MNPQCTGKVTGFLLLTGVFMLCSTVLGAVDPRGVRIEGAGKALISGLRGEVSLNSQIKGTETRTASFRDRVNNGDEIITGPNATAELLFGTRSVLKLGSNTRVRVQTEDGGKEDNPSIVVVIKQGQLELSVSSQNSEGAKEIIIETPSVRGLTKSGLILVEINPRDESERFHVLEGSMQLTDSQDKEIQASKARPFAKVSPTPVAFHGTKQFVAISSQNITLNAGKSTQVINGRIMTPIDTPQPRNGKKERQALPSIFQHEKTPTSGKETLISRQFLQARLLGQALVGAAEEENGNSEEAIENIVLATTNFTSAPSSSSPPVNNLPSFNNNLTGQETTGNNTIVSGQCSSSVGGGACNSFVNVFLGVINPNNPNQNNILNCQDPSSCIQIEELEPVPSDPSAANDNILPDDFFVLVGQNLSVSADSNSIRDNGNPPRIGIVDILCNNCDDVAPRILGPQGINPAPVVTLVGSALDGIDHAVRFRSNNSTGVDARDKNPLDSALFEASGPLVALFPQVDTQGNIIQRSNISTKSDFVLLEDLSAIVKAELVSGDALIQFDASSGIINGNFFNVNDNAILTVNGVLTTVQNGAEIAINEGVFTRVGLDATFFLDGSLIGFGPGVNTVSIQNTQALTAGQTLVTTVSNFDGFPVLLGPNVSLGANNEVVGATVSINANFNPFPGLETLNHNGAITNIDDFTNATNQLTITGESGAVLEIKQGSTVTLQTTP